ncbi:MAG: iron complex transport system substrate-binding protein [Bacteroidetes bacterium]|nr:MAG: iron complex transport system substrate-binding protein [Bacteroidota bacterium]
MKKIFFVINNFRKTPFKVAIILLANFLCFFSCESQTKRIQTIESQLNDSYVNYAKGFSIRKLGHVSELTIYNPWVGGSVLQKTYFISDTFPLPDSLQTSNVIRTPVKSLITLSATQWGPLMTMNEAVRIKGVSEAGFITNKQMRHLFESGLVEEVAADGRYEIEKILRIQPELILYSPDPTGVPTALENLGLPLLAWTDYFETNPLGRTEWIKILGLLVEKEEIAVQMFDSIAADYLRLKNLVSTTKERPTVFADKAFAGQWYVPGGKSYMARLFEDAGATYVFADNNSEASFPLDIETIYARAGKADYWRIAQAASAKYSYEQLKSENELYASFKAFQEKKVVFCNILETSYFERSPLEPNHMLADFIAIFHPELLPDHQPVFHQLLEP